MTTNDEPYVPYRPAYVAGLERRVADQQAAIAQAMEALEAVEWTPSCHSNLYIICRWCQVQYHESYPQPWKHNDDCQREAALAALRRVAGLQSGGS